MRGLWIVGALVLVGCTQTASKWIRTDGQYGPSFAQQFELDRTICLGDTEKAKLSSGLIVGGSFADQVIAGIEQDKAAEVVLRGCMAQRGYVLVPEADAERRAAEFRQARK